MTVCLIAGACIATVVFFEMQGEIDREDQQQLAALRAEVERLRMAVVANPDDTDLREALLNAQADLEDQQFHNRANDGL